MLRIAFVGWRGMVGSVLLARMMEEGDFTGFEPGFFTTSNVGGQGPDVGLEAPPLKDAHDISVLSGFNVVVSSQGGSYTEAVYPELRKHGWDGYWIDAASTLRMHDESIIVLDPVNGDIIRKGLHSGIKTFAGGNCTVSLMLMALGGLFAGNCVEWISSMTYQAASGAGANNMKELVRQMVELGDSARDLLMDPAATAVDIDKRITYKLRSGDLPAEHFSVPLAASLIPWIDRAMENGGQTREEWKGSAETNKILGLNPPVPVDGICVRVGAMRCHSQAFTIKLNRDYPVDELEDMIRNGNDWVKIVPNDKEETISRLTPAAVSGTLQVPVGRIRKMLMGPDYIAAFSCGDQLLWGAAEPLRRILRIVVDHLGD